MARMKPSKKDTNHPFDTFREAEEFREGLTYQERREFDKAVKEIKAHINNFGEKMGKELVYALLKMFGQTDTHPLDLELARSQILHQAYRKYMINDGWGEEYAEESAKRFVNKARKKGDL